MSEEQYDQLHSKISDLSQDSATKTVVNKISFGLRKLLMNNHTEEANKIPLAVLENKIITLCQQKDKLVRIFSFM